MSDSKFFGKEHIPKRGEMQELKEELNNVSKDKVKDAVKKVIAAMTVGKDVAVLFMDMLKCMQTTDIELKKLVYLYLINYAKQQPDLAIMAVNSFVNDSRDPNPLVRALALRTMGCIRVDKIAEYLCDPLRKALVDPDPYVKKTAAICVLKLFDMDSEMVVEQDYIQLLTDLLSDSNPMVVSNVVAALSEISRKVAHFTIDANTVHKLLTVLNEATPWGQVYVLDALTAYAPTDVREAEQIMDRVSPRLSHHNSSVVLSAVRLIVIMMAKIGQGEKLRFARKLAPPLVSLALQNSMPEVQYVALRNISLVIQKLEVLNAEYKVFFCKFNDPLYVKLEKLDLIVRLAGDHNIDAMLSELKEYAQEVDVEFVRKSVRSIGSIAIKLERAAEKSVEVLLELIQSTSNYARQKSNHVVQESIIVIKDVFRKYPNRYEGVIATLCEALDTLDEPEAKAVS
jgi:AP-1 complex subunit beta-1